MTIIHAASTGTPAVVNDAAPYDVTTVAGPGVGAMQFIFGTLKPSNVAFADLTGWTLIIELAGGTGTESTADLSPTRLAAWYRIRDGSEAATYSFTNNTGTPNTGAGAMSAYQTDVGGWATPVAVSGDDATHGTDRSVACGAWASAIAPGDWIVWAFASDTDTALTITSPTITQTGITFGPVSLRNRAINSNGADSGCYSFDAAVTAGSNTNAPTLAFTTSTTQCGPGLAIRLRELAPNTAYPPRRRGPNYRR